MGILNFLKDKKTEGNENKFVGRHQQVCFVKHLLGEEIPSLNWQIATNKDLSERNEVLEKLEWLEKYIESEFYTTKYDVATTFDKIKIILDTGYKSCVLQNDSELESRCLGIYKDVIDYSNNKRKKEGTLTDEKMTNCSDMIEAQKGLGFLCIIDGGLFDSPLEYHAWVVYFSLQPNYYTQNLITDVLKCVSASSLGVLVSGLKLASTKLLENKKIDKNDENKIRKMIEAGIKENEKNHKQKDASHPIKKKIPYER